MTELRFKYEDLIIDDVSDISNEMLLEVISETCFFIPTKLIVNGINVFEYSVQDQEIIDWLYLPSFNLIIDWKKKIDQLPFTEKQILFLADAGEMALFFREGSVKIRTNINEFEVEENYTEFSNSIKSSIGKLMQNLKRKNPKIFENQKIRQAIEL